MSLIITFDLDLQNLIGSLKGLASCQYLHISSIQQNLGHPLKIIFSYKNYRLERGLTKLKTYISKKVSHESK